MRLIVWHLIDSPAKQKTNCEHNHPAIPLHPSLSAVLITDSVPLTRTVTTAPEVSPSCLDTNPYLPLLQPYGLLP